jgi:hypothetical protein
MYSRDQIISQLTAVTHTHFPLAMSALSSPVCPPQRERCPVSATGGHSTFKGSRVASTSSRAARAVRVSAVRPVASGAAGKVKKVVLAYSGGLDTSVILKWLQDTYDCEVVTFTADLGQVWPVPCWNDAVALSAQMVGTDLTEMFTTC